MSLFGGPQGEYHYYTQFTKLSATLQRRMLPLLTQLSAFCRKNDRYNRHKDQNQPVVRATINDREAATIMRLLEVTHHLATSYGHSLFRSFVSWEKIQRTAKRTATEMASSNSNENILTLNNTNTIKSNQRANATKRAKRAAATTAVQTSRSTSSNFTKSTRARQAIANVHTDSYNEGTEQYDCDVCGKGFDKSTDLGGHRHRCEKEREAKTFNQEAGAAGFYDCNKCNRLFQGEGRRNAHQNQCGYKGATHPIEGSSSSSSSSSSSFTKKTTCKITTTTCTFCAKMYHQSTPNYSTQNITHYNKIIGQGKSHPNSSTQKVCEKCDKYVTRGTRHSCTAIKDINKKWKCGFCQLRSRKKHLFDTAHDLFLHQEKMHREREI